MDEQTQLCAFARYLHINRERLLDSWRDAVSADAEVTHDSGLTGREFRDHVPQLLDAFEQRLCPAEVKDVERVSYEETLNAARHGLQRWRQGYALREAIREWGHLQGVLVSIIDDYAADTHVHPGAMRTARRLLVQLGSVTLGESTDSYVRMQQSEAAIRVASLERGIAELKDLERERCERPPTTCAAV